MCSHVCFVLNHLDVELIVDLGRDSFGGSEKGKSYRYVLRTVLLFWPSSRSSECGDV